MKLKNKISMKIFDYVDRKFFCSICVITFFLYFMQFILKFKKNNNNVYWEPGGSKTSLNTFVHENVKV